MIAGAVLSMVTLSVAGVVVAFPWLLEKTARNSFPFWLSVGVKV